jgi:hypothetical protein
MHFLILGKPTGREKTPQAKKKKENVAFLPCPAAPSQISSRPCAADPCFKALIRHLAIIGIHNLLCQISLHKLIESSDREFLWLIGHMKSLLEAEHLPIPS